MTLLSTPDWIEAEWSAPRRVRAISTTRLGGSSPRPFASLNLGSRSGDDTASVERNRSRLCAAAELPSEPAWLRQVHGTHVVRADGDVEAEADGQWTSTPGQVLAILTADCLPVVMTDSAARRVAVAHAGWRGLASGVIENTVRVLRQPEMDLHAWLGPCIGPEVYEVGLDVYEKFVQADPGSERHFQQGRRNNRWLADLPGLARRRLEKSGVRSVAGGEWCTYSDPERFYSYRRDGMTGRMATLAWITD